jgi:signal transduction histidine kinase
MLGTSERLIQGVIVFTRFLTWRKVFGAEFRLRRSLALLRGLLARQERDTEAERKRLAWEMHEQLGQILVATRIRLQASASGPADSGCAAGTLDESGKLLDEAIAMVRKITSSLRPHVLDLDVVASLEWLSAEFMQRHAIPCHVHVDQSALAMGEQCRTTVFRIVEEALDNVASHADALNVDVILSRADNGYVLRVCDDGKGFDIDAVKGSALGLLRTRERARMVGGEARIFSSPGKGTVVEAVLPAL